MKLSLVIFAVVMLVPLALRAEEAAERLNIQQAAQKIDEFLEAHWQSLELKPAPVSDDAEFLRRITLDLAGRVPTTAEVDRFLADKSKGKRQRLLGELIEGPEFSLHFGNVLDAMIQGRFSGNERFIDYLRRSLHERKSWDRLFRELMVGPWKETSQRVANRFIDKRAKNLDTLTVDATRVFFGVDISCAKCHDHPLVEDWKQDHFYGMASFFNRTTGGKGKVGEKKSGEVKFLGENGKEKTAKMMFLTGLVIDDTPEGGKQKTKTISRREQLVGTALAERTFFSRSFVNRMWEYFFGRGLVDPVDQIHSANHSSVPGLLEWLSTDFAASSYDVHRLVAVLVSTRAYALSSQWPDDSTIPAASHFSVAHLRPLTQKQLALSLLLVTGASNFGEKDNTTKRVENLLGVKGIGRVEHYLELEQESAMLARSFDPRIREFQSSASEALFMSNNEAVQSLIRPVGNNLSVRLSQLKSTQDIVDRAVRAVLSRPPDEVEQKHLSEWFDRQQGERQSVCAQLVWSLIASAEFRFNH